jgi:hypothetical protein
LTWPDDDDAASIRDTVVSMRMKEGAVTTTLATSPLTAADRCDRCGAQAYVRVLLASGGELLFCAHHGREHAPALTSAEARIQDESARLLAEQTGAAAPGRD